MKPVKDFLGKPAPAGYVAGAGRHGFTTRPDAAGDTNNPMDWSDDERGLFGGDVIDAEDAEADATFAAVDRVLASRRRVKRDNMEPTVGKVGDVFSDLKQELKAVSVAEWAAIPEAGDRRGKKMRQEQRLERYTPLPDSLLMPDQSSTTVIDSSNTNGGGLERARTLVKGMLRANPDHPDTWLTAIRLERTAGRYKTARSMGRQAVGRIPDNAELWMELVECHTDPAERRTILVEATKHATLSESWQTVFSALVDCEETHVAKMATVKKAIKMFPKSVTLWTHIVSLANDDQERVALLSRACEACPTVVDFWLQLAGLSDSVSVLESAIRVNRDSIVLWLQLLKHTNNAHIPLMIESCNVTIDTDLPDCKESEMVYNHLLDNLPTEQHQQYANHRNEVVRRCAVGRLTATDNTAVLDSVRREPSLAVRLLHDNPSLRHLPYLWSMRLQHSPVTDQAEFETALQAVGTDCEEIWLLYMKYCMMMDLDPKEVIVRARVACPESAEIAYQYCLHVSKDGVEQLAVQFKQHEGIQLLYASSSPDHLQRALLHCPRSVHLWIRACKGATGPAAFRAQWEKARKAVGRHEPLLWCAYLRYCHDTATYTTATTTTSSALKECPTSGLVFYTVFLLDVDKGHANEHVLKSRLLDAAKRYPIDDPFLPLLTGELLLKIDGSGSSRAEEYLERALTLAGNYADVYARLIVLMPSWCDRIKRRFVQTRPTVSSHLPDRIDFSIDDLVAHIHLL